MKGFISPEKGILSSGNHFEEITGAKNGSFLILSDTHGAFDLAEEIISRFTPDISGVIFAGDSGTDIQSMFRKVCGNNGVENFPDLFIAVQGNGDEPRYTLKQVDEEKPVIMELPLVKKTRLCGTNFLITHGHKYHVSYGIENLLEVLKNTASRIGIFGHTHRQYYQEKDGIILINPGSISLPRGGEEPGFAIIEIRENKKPKTTFFSIEYSGLNKEVYFKTKSEY